MSSGKGRSEQHCSLGHEPRTPTCGPFERHSRRHHENDGASTSTDSMEKTTVQATFYQPDARLSIEPGTKPFEETLQQTGGYSPDTSTQCDQKKTRWILVALDSFSAWAERAMTELHELELRYKLELLECKCRYLLIKMRSPSRRSQCFAMDSSRDILASIRGHPGGDFTAETASDILEKPSSTSSYSRRGRGRFLESEAYFTIYGVWSFVVACAKGRGYAAMAAEIRLLWIDADMRGHLDTMDAWTRDMRKDEDRT